MHNDKGNGNRVDIAGFVIPKRLKRKIKALFTPVRYRTVPLRSVPKSGTERGCVHTGTKKIKRSVPKQVHKLGGTEK